MIIIPEGSTLPEDLHSMFANGDDIIQKVNACKDEAKIVSVNTRELQMLVEYRDLFDAEPVAIIGMQGAMYNTVWNTYVSTMERTTLDAFRTTLRDKNDDRSRAGTEAIVRPNKGERLARLQTAPVVTTTSAEPAAEEGDFRPE